MFPSHRDDDHERSRLGCRTSPRLRLIELRSRQIDFVDSIIDVHGLGAQSCRHGLYGLPLAVLLLGNADLALAGAGECLMTVPASGVHASTNGKIGNHLAIICAHYDHLLWLTASDEECVFLSIDG